MPAKKQNRRDNLTVKMSPPELWRFEFSRLEISGDEHKSKELPLSFGLGLSRPSIEKLSVEFSMEIKGHPSFELAVSYRAVFEIDMPDAKLEEVERELRALAVNLAPGTLFPFIRETVATSVVKSGLPPLVLPFVNFRAVFDPADVELPSFNASEEAST